MPEPNSEQNKVLFGAEFDGQKMKEGVEEVLDSLEKTKVAEDALKDSIKETTKAMSDNRKEAEKLAKSKPLDPKLIEDQAKKMKDLNVQYEEQAQHLDDLRVATRKVKEVQRDYTKQQRETERQQESVNKAVGKLTSVNELAADGIRKVGNRAKDAAFSLVSGFAGGIAALVIPQILDLASELLHLNNVQSDFQKDLAVTNEIQSKAAEGYSKDVARLEILRAEINDHNNTNKERIALIKEYNKTAEEGNKIDETQLNNAVAINAAIDRQIGLIKQRAIARAAENIVAEKAEALLKLQFEREERFPQQSDAEIKALNDSKNRIISDAIKKSGRTDVDPNEIFALGTLTDEQLAQMDVKNSRLELLLDKNLLVQLRSIRDRLKLIDEYRKGETGMSAGISVLTEKIGKAQEDFDRAIRIALGLVTPAGLIPFTKTPAAKDEKEIENVFEQKLRELNARLATVSATVFESEGLIRKKFEAQLIKEFGDIGKLLKDGKLTIAQADILKGVLKQINDVELSKGLQEFKKKREDAMKSINDQLIALQVENETKRIANLADQFEKEREQIDLSYNQAIQQITAKQTEFIKAIDDQTNKGLISPEFAKRKKFIAAFVFGNLLNTAEVAKEAATAELAAKQFQRTLELARQPFLDAQLEDKEGTTKQIQEQAQLFLTGKINYEQYQKALTKILKDESNRRRKIQLEEAQDALRRIEEQIQKSEGKQKEDLEKQRDVLRGTIADLNRDIATGSVDKEGQSPVDRFIAYANAINEIASAVVNFWQQANAAEAAALDRSIALQNKRVENARQIAEAGNAEFLEMEQKRLDELDRKREENAKKQLAINNALAASQAIVAAISAIAQAVQSGSALSALAAVGSVIGAITAVYQFVNSLQPQEANFFRGTEYVQGPEGKDRVKANLTKGERVVTARDNKDYWETLSAIHNRAIPPEALNAFAMNYPNMGVPLVDFDRLAGATEGSLGGDSMETLNKLDTVNENLNRVVIGLSEIGVNVKLDENGFEAAISKATKRRILRSRS
jgi:hypothetical protein